MSSTKLFTIHNEDVFHLYAKNSHSKQVRKYDVFSICCIYDVVSMYSFVMIDRWFSWWHVF